jgi:hypothetical protein
MVHADSIVILASHTGRVGSMARVAADGARGYQTDVLLGDREDMQTQLLARRVAEVVSKPMKVPVLLGLGLHRKGADMALLRTVSDDVVAALAHHASTLLKMSLPESRAE